MKLRLLLAVVAALLVAVTVYAQETTTGSIAGQVVDAQGLAVPGATVTISSAQGEKTFVTDAEGRFFAPFLTPGTYTVRVELGGFRPIERRDVNVSLGQRVELPLTLRVGGVTETVDVSAGSSVVDVTSTTAGATLDTGIPFDFLEQIQVKTAGYDAEFGQSTGGVVNVVTKSGSNDFRGTGFVSTQPEARGGARAAHFH